MSKFATENQQLIGSITYINSIKGLNSYSKKEIENFEYNFKYHDCDYGFVYLLVTDKFCKIGISQNVSIRISGILRGLVEDKMNGIYVTKIVSNYRNVEDSFKNQFKIYNIKNEWYQKEFINEYLKFLKEYKYNYNFMSAVEVNRQYNENKKHIEREAEYFVNGYQQKIIEQSVKLFSEYCANQLSQQAYEIKTAVNEIIEINKDYIEFLSKCFPDEMLQELNELTYAQHMPLHDIICKACKEYLEKHRDEVWLDRIQCE